MIETPIRTDVQHRPLHLYINSGPDPVFVSLHSPDPTRSRASAVLFCPPFGWEEVCAYRTLAGWAQSLADAGYPTLRLSYPGTGDSGGSPRDPERLAAFVASVLDAAGWLRDRTGAERITAVGMGLGGLLAHLATARGAAIDDLVLWGCPTRGRSLIRQLTAVSNVERSQIFGERPDPDPLPEGALAVGGFLLSPETVRELKAVELDKLPLTDSHRRRVLLLDRDGLAAHEPLRAQLEASGVEVTEASGQGYASMTSHPQEARPALAVWTAVRAWIDATPEAATPAPPPRAHDADVRIATTALIGTGSGAVRETPITISRGPEPLSGVLVEPTAPARGRPAVVLLNGGAVRRIGPNRMWVEAARRWAAQGVSTLRLDMVGIGDSAGDSSCYVRDGGLYVPELVPAVLSALDELEARGWGQRYVLGGLCAGAYWAFHASLADPRVCATMMVNPRAIVWNDQLEISRDVRDVYTRRMSLRRIVSTLRSPSKLRRIVRLASWMVVSPSRWQARRGLGGSNAELVGAALERLARSGKPALVVFSDAEPLEEELTKTGLIGRLHDAPNVSIERIAVRDHTLRPNWSQGAGHRILDTALARVLEPEPFSESPPGPVPG